MNPAADIPKHHPLRTLFASLTEKSFIEQLGWADSPVMGYVSDLLVKFSQSENLYRIRNGSGKRLDEVGEMLLEADLLLHAGSLEREREVYRHIGDFTLFMVGLFPEYLKRIKAMRLIHHADFLIDYIRVGKRSYRNVAEFTFGSYKDNAPLFNRLSENFEVCVMGLGYIRTDLERLRVESFRKAKKILLN
jgi:hypothetical protein